MIYITNYINILLSNCVFFQNTFQESVMSIAYITNAQFTVNNIFIAIYKRVSILISILKPLTHHIILKQNHYKNCYLKRCIGVTNFAILTLLQIRICLCLIYIPDNLKMTLIWLINDVFWKFWCGNLKDYFVPFAVWCKNDFNY